MLGCRVPLWTSASVGLRYSLHFCQAEDEVMFQRLMHLPVVVSYLPDVFAASWCCGQRAYLPKTLFRFAPRSLWSTATPPCQVAGTWLVTLRSETPVCPCFQRLVIEHVSLGRSWIGNCVNTAFPPFRFPPLHLDQVCALHKLVMLPANHITFLGPGALAFGRTAPFVFEVLEADWVMLGLCSMLPILVIVTPEHHHPSTNLAKTFEYMTTHEAVLLGFEITGLFFAKPLEHFALSWHVMFSASFAAPQTPMCVRPALDSVLATFGFSYCIFICSCSGPEASISTYYSPHCESVPQT